MAILKLRVSPSVFARLFEELEQDPNQFQVRQMVVTPGSKDSYCGEVVNVVRILPGERKFTGKNVEVTLELLEEVTTEILAGRESVTSEKVGRAKIDVLFDFLKIFPQAQKKTRE